MGRTVGQQWYGGTEGSPWDSLQSLPGLTGWEGLGKISILTVYLPGTPFSPQDSTVPGALKDVQWRQGNSDGKPGHHSGTALGSI